MEEMKNYELNEQETENVTGGQYQVNADYCHGINFHWNGYHMYKVVEGDWLSGIANYYHTSVDTLIRMNQRYVDAAQNTIIYNPNMIHPGDRFIIGWGNEAVGNL